MPAIDQAQLLIDTNLWLPDDNALTDAQLTAINIRFINLIGDDEIYAGEVLCKSLRNAAQVNKGMSNINSGVLRSQKIDKVEFSYHKTTNSGWDAYIKSLKDICPLFGYSLPASLGLKISSGDPIEIPACPDNTDLIL